MGGQAIEPVRLSACEPFAPRSPMRYSEVVATQAYPHRRTHGRPSNARDSTAAANAGSQSYFGASSPSPIETVSR
jgi:hypothetical protein